MAHANAAAATHSFENTEIRTAYVLRYVSELRFDCTIKELRVD